MWCGALRPRHLGMPFPTCFGARCLSGTAAAPKRAMSCTRRDPCLMARALVGHFGACAHSSRTWCLWRQFASMPVPHSSPRSALAPEGQLPQTLAQLSQTSGLLPRPEIDDERLKPGFRGGKALAIFFLLNAVPFGGLLYYLRAERDRRAEMSLMALPAQPEDVAAEAQRVVRTAATCFMLKPVGTSAAGAGAATGAALTVRVDPHPPEGTAYVPPTEPLPLVPQLERNDITDIFESPTVAGLDFIHFALSRSSPSGASVLAGDRQASLLYVSHARGAYCTIIGQMSVLADADSRRHYWKGPWASSFPLLQQASPTVSAVPSAGSVSGTSAERLLPPAPWANSDYLLVRFAVSEVCLGVLVEGPQRWDERRIQRLDERRAGEGGRKWAQAPQ